MASILMALKPILGFLPEVKTPSMPPSFSQRMIWTVFALLIYFAMYNVLAIGVDQSAVGDSDFLSVVTASRPGSLLTTGIGPIVLASIFLQLFVGAKIIDIDMKDPEQKAVFHGTQKLLAIFLCFFEAYVFVVLGRLDVIALPFFGDMTALFVVLQIALGSMILLYLDEVVSKYGIGSGISLFIAAGVSFAIVKGLMAIFLAPEVGVVAIMQEGGADVIAKSLSAMLPILFTAIVFLVIVYVEGIKVIVPLAFERARGVSTGFPIKFTYVSNIPVILAFALIANFQLMGGVLVDQHFCVTGELVDQPELAPLNACVDKETGEPGVDLFNIIGRSTRSDSGGAQFVDGIMYMISPVYRSPGEDYGQFFEYMFSEQSNSPVWGLPYWLHIVVYIIFLMIICVIFGQFWVETTNMGPSAVADQLNSAGLQIPGYRRDPRVITAMLEKYIPPIVVMGSAFVGLLAGLADLTGALGTGTGILLTVGIIYRMYQDIEKQNVFGSNLLASRLFGKK